MTVIAVMVMVEVEIVMMVVVVVMVMCKLQRNRSCEHIVDTHSHTGTRPIREIHRYTNAYINNNTYLPNELFVRTLSSQYT